MKNLPPQNDLTRILNELPPDDREKLQEVWEAMPAREPGAPAFKAQDIEDVWRNVKARRNDPTSKQPGAKRRMPKLHRLSNLRFWMTAAASVLIAAIGIVLWNRPIVRQAMPGERLSFTLPDGSTVELNSGSTLQYPRRFDNSRDVYLSGEAFFSVAKQGSPFVVRTYNSTVEVLGTRFNVRAWEHSLAPSSTVALESGSVRFASLSDASLLYDMIPGEMRRIGVESREYDGTDTFAVRNAMSWRNGDLIFSDEPLGDVLEEIERRFDLTVELRHPDIEKKRINVAERAPVDADSVIDNLCAALGINYRATASGFEIY